MHWIGGWAESNVGLDGSGVNVLPRRGFELPTVQPIAGSYTDCSMQLVSGRSLTAKARARSRRHSAWDIFCQNFVFPCQHHVHAILNTEPRILQNSNTLDKYLSLSQRSLPTGAHPGKAAGSWSYLPPSSAQVRSEWSYTSTPCHIPVWGGQGHLYLYFCYVTQLWPSRRRFQQLSYTKHFTAAWSGTF